MRNLGGRGISDDMKVRSSETGLEIRGLMLDECGTRVSLGHGGDKHG